MTFSAINQFRHWKFWSLSVKLVHTCVTSDMTTHVRS